MVSGATATLEPEEESEDSELQEGYVYSCDEPIDVGDSQLVYEGERLGPGLVSPTSQEQETGIKWALLQRAEREKEARQEVEEARRVAARRLRDRYADDNVDDDRDDEE